MNTEKKEWDGITLEEVIREAVRQGSLETIANLIKLLPEEKQARYRLVAKEEIAALREAK